MELVISSEFDSKYQETKEEIYKEMKERIDEEVLNEVKRYLRVNNIVVNEDEKGLKEFKEEAFKALGKKEQIAVTNIENVLTKELSEIVELLYKGSLNIANFEKIEDEDGIKELNKDKSGEIDGKLRLINQELMKKYSLLEKKKIG